jgi:hypothetical protein
MSFGLTGGETVIFPEVSILKEFHTQEICIEAKLAREFVSQITFFWAHEVNTLKDRLMPRYGG